MGSIAKSVTQTASHVAALVAEASAAEGLATSQVAREQSRPSVAAQRRSLLKSFNSRKLRRTQSGTGTIAIINLPLSCAQPGLLLH